MLIHKSIRRIPRNLFQLRTINTNFGETKSDALKYYRFLRKKGFKIEEIWIWNHNGLFEFHVFKTPNTKKILTKAKVGSIY